MIEPKKELGPLLKLCRKFGVTEITLEGVSIKFGAMPTPKSGAEEVDDDEVQTDGLTPEQLMFFSAPRDVEGMGG